MEPADKIKKDIAKRYDTEALEKEKKGWSESGNNARVPEPASAQYFIDRKVDTALKMLGSSYNQNMKVLEIGCSFGHMTSLLSAKFNHMTAVDLSAKSIEIAEKRLKHFGISNVNFIADDAEVLNKIPDNSFDVVFSFSTLRFCPEPEKALKAIFKKLKPNGILIADFPNSYSPWHLLIKKMSKIEKHIHDHLYTPKEAISLVSSSGYLIEQSKCFLFTSKRLPGSVLPLFKIADLVLEKTPLFRQLSGIIMIRGRKK